MKRLFVLFFAFLAISVRAGEDPWMEVPLSPGTPEMTEKLSDPLWQGAVAIRLDANVAAAPDMTVSWPLAFQGAFQGRLSGMDNLRFICRIYDKPIDADVTFVDEFSELGIYMREPVAFR